MKIAIFHNYMDNIGGAEIVDLLLAKELGADIYTTNIDTEKIEKMGFDSSRVKSIGRVPINAPFKQEASNYLFRRLNLGKKYDFYIIAGDWAMSGAIKNKPHLWYVYSPTREIWDLYSYMRENVVPWYKLPVYDLWVKYRRFLNKRDVKNVQHLVAISGVVQKRISRYLGRDSIVVHAPIDSKKYYNKPSKKYWLSVNRLFAHKRVDMQLKAFAKMPDQKLIVVGSYEKAAHFTAYADYIKKLQPANVEIRSWVSDEELLQLYAECQGVITTSKNEDYGLTPIEAMASGKPSIVPAEGGYVETTFDKEHGRVMRDITPEKIVKAVTEINAELEENPAMYIKRCQKHAQTFDISVFAERIKQEIQTVLQSKTTF